MISTTKNTQSLTSMLDLCRQVTPYLDGKIEAPLPSNSSKTINNQWLTGHAQDFDTIQALKDDLTAQHPNAGTPYLQARLWNLLCWQPIYISFISIYGLKLLPEFDGFKQQRQHNAIIGFTFQSNNISSGETEQLIAQAALQLKPLIEHYRIQLDSLLRCRPAYAGRFVADSIMSNLLKVKAFDKNFNDEMLLNHAKLWLNALALPHKLLNSLQINSNQTIQLVRTSCCLADKINEKLCADCPRAHKQTLLSDF